MLPVRARRWSKPVAALAAAFVLIVGVVSAIALTSGSDAPDVAAPVDVTWTLSCAAPVARPGQGFFQTCETLTTSDPRLSGIEENNYIEIHDGGPKVAEGTVILTNDQGTWEGSFKTFAVHGATPEEYATVGNWVGRGGYDGLRLASLSRATGDPNGSGHTAGIHGTISPIDPEATHVDGTQTCEAPVTSPSRGPGRFQTCVDVASDPRLSGTEESDWFEINDGPWIREGTLVLTNDQGSWEGPFRTRTVDGTGPEEYLTVGTFVGRGGYEGLTYTGMSRSTGDPNGSGHTSIFFGTISPVDP